MNILKVGSKGDDVKKLQTFLKLTADGDFGKKTEAAVKTWQKANGLTADGIVGQATWNKMFPSSTTSSSKVVDSNVIYKPLNVHITKLANRPITYLAIHFTAGSNSKPGRALTMYNIFTSYKSSADFGVDDRDIVQFNPDLKNYYCWAVGDNKNKYSSGGQLNSKASNRNTISIEICSTCTPTTQSSVSTANHAGWSFTEDTLNNAAKLAKILMKKYNIPLERVVRHYDITGKLCPGVIGWNNEAIYDNKTYKATNKKSTSDAWLAFKERLK